MYFSFFKLKKWGIKTAAARRHNCAVLPYMFPLNFMSTIYFVFGFCQAATGYAAWVFQKQEEMK